MRQIIFIHIDFTNIWVNKDGPYAPRLCMKGTLSIKKNYIKGNLSYNICITLQTNQCRYIRAVRIKYR